MKRHMDLDKNVAIASLKGWILLHLDLQQEISRSTTAIPRCSFAFQTEDGSVFHSFRNTNFQALRFLGPPLAKAGGAL